MTTKSNENLEGLMDKFKQKSAPEEKDQISPVDLMIKRRGMYHQVLAVCAILLLSASCGIPIGYSAVLLPQLAPTLDNSTIIDANYPEIIIDIEMGSWIASVHSLATPIGSLFSGPLADSIGRRSTLLFSVIPTFIGWCILALANSYPMIIVGRVLCGLSTGLLGGPAQVYIAEATEPTLRGLLIGAPFVSYSIGILIVYALGTTMHWRTVAWCGNILPALSALAIYLMPESPAWLLRNNRQPAALKSLTFLRGNEIVGQKELNEMSKRLSAERAASPEKEENIFQLCCKRVAIKPLFIVIIFALLQMFTGTFIMVFYAIDIISEFGAGFDTKTAAIWTAVVRTLCTLVCCVILLIVRRRSLVLVSGLGSGLSCLVLSIFMYARVFTEKSSLDVIVAAACLLIYIAFNTALMVMPGIMIGELFPAKIRGRTAGGVFAMMNFSLFGLSKAFPYIQSVIKMRGVFMLFAVSSFLVCTFMLAFQPETKGRTLDEIEDYFNESNWLWFNRNKNNKAVQTKSIDKEESV